jgi:hypothetical protein
MLRIALTLVIAIGLSAVALVNLGIELMRDEE